MSALVHLHFHVRDLKASREFYEKFLGAKPVKALDDYVKFLPAVAPINLALSPAKDGAPSSPAGHLGIQVETPHAVQEHLTRVKAAGLAVLEEQGVNCCHANQDKFWVQDPDGRAWEIYHLNYDLPAKAESKSGACCADALCPGS